MEKVFPIEYLGIQLDFAKRAAELSSIGLYTALRKYTSIVRMANLPHSTPDRHPFMSGMQQIASAVEFSTVLAGLYGLYETYSKIPFPQEERLSYGCFALSVLDSRKVSHIHFSTKDENRPLNIENLGQRRKELIKLFEQFKTSEHSKNTEQIGGFSWLYNLTSYKVLFPADYAESGQIKEWFGSLAKWGQFLNYNYTLRESVVPRFRAKVAEAKNMSELINAFPFQTLEVRAPVESFYKLT